MFSMDYFGQKAYLAQSPQLYKQAMVASGLERVFEIGHAYRAEKHETPRHITNMYRWILKWDLWNPRNL